MIVWNRVFLTTEAHAISTANSKLTLENLELMQDETTKAGLSLKLLAEGSV